MYGDRCHFRHEFRSFTKIHRHFYMAHAAALRMTAVEILELSKQLPDEMDCEEDKLVLMAMGQRGRLACFEAIEEKECASPSMRSSSETDS